MRQHFTVKPIKKQPLDVDKVKDSIFNMICLCGLCILVLTHFSCSKESSSANDDYVPDFQIVIDYLKEDSTNYFSSGQSLLGDYLSFEVVEETCNYEVNESGKFSSLQFRFPYRQCWFVESDSLGQVHGVTDFLIVIERKGFGVDTIIVKGAEASFKRADLVIYNNDTITFFDGEDFQQKISSSAIPVFYESGEILK